MADPRVINLPNGPAGPDPSGVGTMLFDRMQEQFKASDALKQEDALGSIRQKYKDQSAEKANQYNQGMEVLRNTLSQAKTRETWAHEQELKQQEAGALEQLIGQAAGAGVPLPGMTQPGEVMGSAVQPDTAKPVPAGGVASVRTMFAAGLAQKLREQEDRSKLSTELERDQIRQMMDLTTDTDARQAESLAAAFEAAGDVSIAAQIRAQFGTAGQASKTVWKQWQTTGMGKLQVSQAANDTRRAITTEITQRNKDVAAMKIAAQKLIANTKVDHSTYLQMDKLHAKMTADVNGRNALQKAMTDQLLTMLPGSPEYTKIQREQRQNADAIDSIHQDMAGLRGKMAGYTSKTTGELAQPATPGFMQRPNTGARDPLGIRVVK